MIMVDAVQKNSFPAGPRFGQESVAAKRLQNAKGGGPVALLPAHVRNRFGKIPQAAGGYGRSRTVPKMGNIGRQIEVPAGYQTGRRAQ